MLTFGMQDFSGVEQIDMRPTCPTNGLDQAAGFPEYVVEGKVAAAAAVGRVETRCPTMDMLNSL